MDSNLNDDDIICLLDGDDKLIVDSALDTIDSLYNDNTLLTYGQYIWPNGHIGHCKEYTEYEFSMLKRGYWASHLRTFKFKLYKELIKQDPKLNCYKDNLGEFYKSCYDVAIMTPLMEIAGFDNIKFNPTPVYFYRLHEQNDHSVDPILQKNIADEVFNKNTFKRYTKMSINKFDVIYYINCEHRTDRRLHIETLLSQLNADSEKVNKLMLYIYQMLVALGYVPEIMH
jgi:hypothetical protein